MKRILFALLAVFTAFSVYLTAPKLDAMNVAESPGWYRIKQSNVVDEITVDDRVYPIAENNNYYSATNGFRTNPETFVTKWDASPSYYHVYHTIKLDNTIDKLYVTKTDGTVIFEIDVNNNLDYTKGDHITAGIRWDKVNGVDKTRFYYEFNGETVESLTTVKEYKLYYTTTYNNVIKNIQYNDIISIYGSSLYKMRDGSYKYLDGEILEVNISGDIVESYGDKIFKLSDGSYNHITSTVTELTLSGDIVESYGGAMFKLSDGSYNYITSTVTELTLSGDIVESYGDYIFKLSDGSYNYITSTVTELTLSGDIVESYGDNIFKLSDGNYNFITSTVTELTLSGDIVESYGGNIFKLSDGNYNFITSTVTELTLSGDIVESYGDNIFKLSDGSYNYITNNVTELTLSGDIVESYGGAMFKLSDGSYNRIYGTVEVFDNIINIVDENIALLDDGKLFIFTEDAEISITNYTKVTKLYYGNGYTTYQKIDYIEKGTAIDASFEEDKPTTLINTKAFSHYSLTKDGTKLPIGTVLVEDFTVHSVLKDVKIPIKVHIDNQVDTLYYYNGDVIELETPVKDGYLFKHWSLKPDGPEASLVAGNTYTNVPKEFYAVWDKTYKVTFVNGYDIHTEQIVIENQRVEAPEAPKKLDHKFVGWYKDFETTEVFKITDVITEDTTLYAKFTSSDQGGGIIPTPKPGNLTNSELILIGVGSVVLLLAVVVFFNRKK